MPDSPPASGPPRARDVMEEKEVLEALRQVLDPPWHPGLMTDAARRQLGWSP